jgi:hypothetical protein
VVKWHGGLSSEFPLRQGTGQGRSLATTHYTVFNNDLRLRIDDIGDIPVGTPACADGGTLLADSNSTHPQAMTSCVEHYANENRYTIGMKKTTKASVTFKGESIPNTDTAIQLGVLQSKSNKVNFLFYMDFMSLQVKFIPLPGDSHPTSSLCNTHTQG